jgi:hypothetical protein
VKRLRTIVTVTVTGTGTALVSTAACHSLCLLVLGVILLAILAMGIIAAATFSKRNAPMTRLRALVRDLRG